MDTSLFALSAAKITFFITNQCIKKNVYKLFFSFLDCLDYIFQAILFIWTISEVASRYVQKKSSSE